MSSWTRSTAAVAVAAFEVAGALRRQVAAEVREGGGEGPLAEVEGDDGPGVVLEGDEGRLLAARAGAATDVLGQAVALQVRDELADARAGEAGEARDVGAADRAQVVERAQDEGRVVGAGLRVGGLATGIRCVPRVGCGPLTTSSRELTKRIVCSLAPLCQYHGQSSHPDGGRGRAAAGDPTWPLFRVAPRGRGTGAPGTGSRHRGGSRRAARVRPSWQDRHPRTLMADAGDRSARKCPNLCRNRLAMTILPRTGPSWSPDRP